MLVLWRNLYGRHHTAVFAVENLAPAVLQGWRRWRRYAERPVRDGAAADVLALARSDPRVQSIRKKMGCWIGATWQRNRWLTD